MYLVDSRVEQILRGRLDGDGPFTVLYDVSNLPGNRSGFSPFVVVVVEVVPGDIAGEYALKTKSNPIGVAEYQLQSRLAEEF